MSDVLLDPARSREMLEALGIEVLQEQGDEVLAMCPMHRERTGKEDHNPSWNFNLVSGLSLCFSCSYATNAVGLVADVMGFKTKKLGLVDYEAAEKWLEDFALDPESQLGRIAKMRRFRSPDEYVPKLVPMTEARLAVFSPEPPAWALKARKIDQEACTRYGVLWDHATDCWITPLRDPETGKLIGYQQKGQGNRYFRNRPPGVRKSQTLFGLDAHAPGSPMIVVESPLDALRLDMLGYSGAVSTCGAKISEAQMQLMAFRASEILLALDADQAGRKATEEFYTAFTPVGVPFSCLNYRGTDAKDVGDMDDAEVDWAVENAVSSIWGVDALLTGRTLIG